MSLPSPPSISVLVPVHGDGRYLTAALDSLCGADSPPSTSIRNTLQDARQTVTHVVREVAGVVLDDAADAAPAAAEPAMPSASAAAPVAAAAPGEIQCRDDAFRVLGRVADWFRDHEPHSPLASVLYQAVRWGRMPLRQLVEELIPDAAARDHFGLLTGLGGRSTPQDDE